MKKRFLKLEIEGLGFRPGLYYFCSSQQEVAAWCLYHSPGSPHRKE
jgi:hypothetical protein